MQTAVNQRFKNVPQSQLYQTQEIDYPGTVYMSTPNSGYQSNGYVGAPQVKQVVAPQHMQTFYRHNNHHPVHIRTQPPVPTAQFTTTTPSASYELEYGTQETQPAQPIQSTQTTQNIQPAQQIQQVQQQQQQYQPVQHHKHIQPVQQQYQQQYQQQHQQQYQPFQRVQPTQTVQPIQPVQQFKSFAPEPVPVQTPTEAPTPVAVANEEETAAPIPTPTVRAPTRRVVRINSQKTVPIKNFLLSNVNLKS